MPYEILANKKTGIKRDLCYTVISDCLMDELKDKPEFLSINTKYRKVDSLNYIGANNILYPSKKAIKTFTKNISFSNFIMRLIANKEYSKLNPELLKDFIDFSRYKLCGDHNINIIKTNIDNYLTNSLDKFNVIENIEFNVNIDKSKNMYKATLHIERGILVGTETQGKDVFINTIDNYTMGNCIKFNEVSFDELIKLRNSISHHIGVTENDENKQFDEYTVRNMDKKLIIQLNYRSFKSEKGIE